MALAKVFKTSAAALVGMTFANSAFAQENLGPLESLGKPIDKLMGFQAPATQMARDIQSLDTGLLWLIGIITLFVTALLIVCIVRLQRKA